MSGWDDSWHGLNLDDEGDGGSRTAIGNLIAHFEIIQHTELSIKMDPS